MRMLKQILAHDVMRGSSWVWLWEARRIHQNLGFQRGVFDFAFGFGSHDNGRTWASSSIFIERRTRVLYRM